MRQMPEKQNSDARTIKTDGEDLSQMLSIVNYNYMWHHQKQAFDKSANLPNYAFIFDPRCGKSLAALSTAAYQYLIGRINGILIITWPNSTKRVWIDEIAKHISSEIRHEALVWFTGAKETKYSTRNFSLSNLPS